MKNIKKILIIVLVLFEVFSLHLMYKSYNNKNILEDKNTNLLQNNNKIAIKVQNDSGSYEDRTTFPGAGYTLNKSMTECVDQNGSPISVSSLTSDGSTVTINSKYTAYCTLYFIKSISLGTYCSDMVNMGICLANKKSGIGEVKFLTSNLVGGMHRYQSEGEDVNNFICFGTNDLKTCLQQFDKYLYRIIGVTDDGQLELVKFTQLRSSATDGYYSLAWNFNYTQSDCGTSGQNCTWEKSLIFNRINGLCSSTNDYCKSGVSIGTSDIDRNNIFIGSDYYDYFNSILWSNKVVNHRWYYGDVDDIAIFQYFNGDIAYRKESAFTAYIDAKIGLPYFYDYFYAFTDGISSPGTVTWMDPYASNSNLNDWVITRQGIVSGSITGYLIGHGNIYSRPLREPLGGNVRPVFYLIPNVKISATSGSYSDPFIILN